MSGQIRPYFVQSQKSNREIAMVNQKLFTMKQPELGKKISEMRKAKGLTQEELVELCNLNVRTIQRIEAGEVTPRSYTIKALFEALGIETKEFKNEPNIEINNTKLPWLYAGLAGGLVYFFLSYFEISMEIEWLEGALLQKTNFAWVKIGTLLTFSLFLLGLKKMAEAFPNKILKISLLLMLVFNAFWITIDLISLLGNSFSIEDYYYVKLASFGLAYGLMGIGFMTYKNLWSNIPQIIGALGIVAGVLIFSVIGALFGLIPLTLFELGEIGFLIWGINKIGRTSSPDSTFSSQVSA